jgi:antitoxin CptB
MADMDNDETRETRIKRLRYRANHRGIKEMDIVIGGFANECLDDLSDSQIDAFEALMAEHDRDLIVWVTGEAPFPMEELKPIFEMVCTHANRAFAEKFS